MLVTTALAILVTSELCLAIRVPITWEQSGPNSEVKNDDENFSVETIEPQKPAKQIPTEYFEYTAKKPQFAADIAAFHGVKSPEQHYKAYPIEPYTGYTKPELGRHKHVNEHLLRPLQEYGDGSSQVEPISSSYEVFHPYEAEVPALQELYKDPILIKIKNDLEYNKDRLKKYESEAGKPNISQDEYLESPHKTDGKLFPQRNIPAPYEVHRPQRRPIYYRPVPKLPHRDQYLNHKLRHPWNQYVKVKPMHYRPIKNHIHNLRQNHALKYDDERNEYPQVHVLENYSDPKDGYDIYEKGQSKFNALRNNVDESINKAVKENRPETYGKLEMQSHPSEELNEEEEHEFVPIKNYAQVRKFETYKHLPRSAAFADAESYDEIRNAPRLREAVKSTKAQTVYSEEGYEDAAYDHAGEQKHAEENEGHGGYLKQKELSAGKYKTPSVSGSHEDEKGSIYRDKLVHDEKWKEDNVDNKEEIEEEDYTEREHEKELENDHFVDTSKEDENHRIKRENNLNNDTETSPTTESNSTVSDSQHDVDKRQVKFEVPDIDFNSTFLSEKDILKMAKLKVIPKKDDLKHKYPYYFKNLKSISKHSPLRYAENLKFIPKKSKGGTEFYNSRSQFECPEVEDVPDPIPDKLKDGSNPDETDSTNKGEENFDTAKKTPRLGGLGDKIDCFKAKYFGENPLDSPFFKEDIIQNPEPVTPPSRASYKLLGTSLNVGKEPKLVESKVNKASEKIVPNIEIDTSELYTLINNLREKKLGNRNVQSLPPIQHLALPSLIVPESLNVSEPTAQTNIYSDVLHNIKNILKDPVATQSNLKIPNVDHASDNVTYNFYQSKEDITKSPVRKRRSTSFIYEPYKIIREGQIQDSKKTTTTSNISPLIKQLQLSKVADKVSKTSQNEDTDRHVKRNVNSRNYKDISRKDREEGSKNDKPIQPEIVDVSVDKRRGEPRYEIKHTNHKSEYTPVANKKAISTEDYKNQTTSETTTEKRRRRPTAKPYFDVNKFIPQIADIQNIAAASNSVRRAVTSSTEAPKKQTSNDNDDDDDYEEYDDDDEDEEEEENKTTTTTTTTTTPKPSFRRRIRSTTTTEKQQETTEQPILKLVTRFRDYKPEETPNQNKNNENDAKVRKELELTDDDTAPKYREKKKKSSKSTLVTDTKKYGDNDDDSDNDDMGKDEVDAMMRVQQDEEDYMPSYEKEKRYRDSSSESDEDDDEEDDDEDEDDDDELDDEDDEEEEDDDEDDRIESEDEDDTPEEETKEEVIETTSPEPTKRTLSVTTDAPIPTAASKSAKVQVKPVVTRKKIEIHKELPVNKSLPHTTQYKQDIEEIEIVKEIPNKRKRRPIKHSEAFQLYKDDKLAEEINNLGAVEVFKENLDLRTAPRHGGNYKSVLNVHENEALIDARNTTDPEASQSEFKRQVELEEDSAPVQMHGGHIKTNRNLQRKAKASKPHAKSAKLEIEESEEDSDDDSASKEEDAYRSPRLHGGNYRSANLEVKPTEAKSGKEKLKDSRRAGAVFLDTFARAVPVLTTTPKYILDPSKRMYYYVDE